MTPGLRPAVEQRHDVGGGRADVKKKGRAGRGQTPGEDGQGQPVGGGSARGSALASDRSTNRPSVNHTRTGSRPATMDTA